MNRIINAILILFAVLLPWHAVIAGVFSPLRWWKEVGLVVLLVCTIIGLWQYYKQHHKIPFTRLSWSIVLFCFWVAILVYISPEPYWGGIAARYLLTGTLTLFCVHILSCTNNINVQNFWNVFIVSTSTSVVFGLWIYSPVPFFEALYSNTVSSWVPGQAPIVYHEAWGIPREQGGLSGPVAFAHLCLIALYGLTITPWRRYHWGGVLLLSTGIILSMSRGAWLGVLLLVLLSLCQWTQKHYSIDKIQKYIALMGAVMMGLIALLFPWWSNVLYRAGTIDHIHNPIQALQIGTKHFFMGSLGSLGPAARMQNMALHNTDKALIAENVFIDVFAQTGIIGFILYISIWYYLYRTTTYKILVFLFFVVAQLATLFDMIPLAIAFFLATGITTKTTVAKAEQISTVLT